MGYFPFFMDIGQKRCLIVGGGVVALRKIEKLLPFGAEVTVVSPAFCAEIEQMKGISRLCRKFQAADVEGMFFVIGATNDESTNAELAALCKQKNIPVNIVDDAEKCTFLFPALVKRGAFVAGCSTGGASPLAARYARAQMEDVLPDGFADVIDMMAAVRVRVKTAFADSQKRERVLKELFSLAMERNGSLSPEEIEKCIRIEECIRKEEER